MGGGKKSTPQGPQAKLDGAQTLSFGDKQVQSGSSSVPVHRTLNQEQPLVFPSSFDATDTQVRPVEPLNNFGPNIPYGPRALHVGANGLPIQKKRKKRRADILSRTERSADIGVQSGYEVVSEVDLDFIYGVCLPATGFSALFVLLSLTTVVSVIVSGF